MNYRIMVADDDSLNRKLICDILSALGYNIIEAVDGLQCIKLANQNSPDLILMDIQMPYLNGFQTLQRLQRGPKAIACPVIALTACVMQDDICMIEQSGFDDYISKPIDTRAFAKKISRLLPLNVKFF